MCLELPSLDDAVDKASEDLFKWKFGKLLRLVADGTLSPREGMAIAADDLNWLGRALGLIEHWA